MSEKELLASLDAAVKGFRGDLATLESAIGMLVVGRSLGWKVMYLIHDKKTIKKYEKILALNIRDVLPPEGKLAERSIAWKAAKKIGNFWKAVKGEITGIRTPELG